ncbi:hypothetical protein C4D60_Mb07t24320 [Musa balbisiana]|uniref:NADPH-protochlorophyllide oxidoreductase n=1 Tax=Musa balbisiana TaxID=52838 RepID=A0A4S8JIF4_MUSBA|nr:hypothetical protein C4D60_Mb07t24320 [Musa balbisiana]
MRVKKQKRHRKVVRFYSACFGFREPYKVLCDGTFIHHLLHHRLTPADDVISHLLGARALLFTTRCIIGELRSLGESHSEALEAAQQLFTARCDHEKRVGATACVESVIGEANSEHFFVATQDADMRKKFREVPGVPVIYGLRNSLFIEQPSAQQRQYAKSTEEKRLHMGESEYLKLYKSDLKGVTTNDSTNRVTEGTQLTRNISTTKRMLGVAEKSKFKRKRAKGPNPLSCKKKKKDDASAPQNQDGVDSGVTKKKIRKRKRAKETASFLPSALSARKEGKVACTVKESAFLGSSIFEHHKSQFNAPVLRTKRESNHSVGVVKAQTTAVAAPGLNQSAVHGKKVLRKGVVVITGASSGLGLAAAKALAETEKWHVVMACRDFLKAEKAAQSAGMAKENYSIMHLDLASLDSVRQFVHGFRQSGRPLDVLVCNAAIYRPTARTPTYTADGYEMSVGVNHLGHFLLANMLLEDLKKSDYPSRRLIILGSITGNTNTLAGNVPPKAGLGDLRGLAGGLDGRNSSAMIDGGTFDGAKAYKDSKICNMLTMQELHRRFHEDTGITFASLYPGCIATTGLFREHIPLFRLLFPPFQKFITKGFVSEDESGKRLAQVVGDPSLLKSGVYWSWNNNSASFENQLSEEASDAVKAQKLWEISEKLVGLA